jgi:hypothetical protein
MESEIMTTPITAPANLDKKIQASMIDRPFKALEGCTTAIYTALEKAEKAAKNPIPLNKDIALSELRTAVHATVDYVTFAVLNFQTQGTGFAKDPSGLLTGESTFSSAPMMKKYQFSGLVQQYADEYLATKALEKNSDAELISETEAAKLLSSESQMVDATLTDGTKMTFDRENNNIGVHEPDGKVSWYRAGVDLGKGWLSSIWGKLVAWGLVIKEWCMDKYKSIKGFFSSDCDDESTEAQKADVPPLAPTAA